MTAHLIAKYRRSRNYDRMYGAQWEFQRDGRYGLIPYEVFGNRTLILWNGLFPFLFSNQQEKKTTGKNENSNSNATKIYSTLTFVRGTLNVEKVLREACSARNEMSWANEQAEQEAKFRFVIHHVPKRQGKDDDSDHDSNGLAWYQQGQYRLLAHAADDLGKRPTNNGKALDNLIFPQRIKDLIREIELWRKSRDWYREKGIPWKRGWMLYGPPGHRQDGPRPRLRRRPEHADLRLQPGRDGQPRADEGVERDADERAVHRAHRGHRQRVPRAGEREPQEQRVRTVRHDGRRQAEPQRRRRPRRRPGQLQQPAHLRLPAQLPRRGGAERRGVHGGDDERYHEGGPGARPATESCRTAAPSSSAPAPAASTRRSNSASWSRPTRSGWPAASWGLTRRSGFAMLEFVDKFSDLEETPAQFQERCAQAALKCFWREKHADALLASAEATPVEVVTTAGR